VELLTAAGVDLSFSLVSPHAVTWAATSSAQLVTGVTEGTRDAIRLVMEHAMASGESVYDTRTALLLRRVIGLTERQAGSVEAFGQRLAEQGLGAEEIASRSDRYAQALLRQRAQMIARTETIASANEGQQAAWREAKAQGLIEEDRTRRVWMTADDDRVDTEICEPLDGQEATLDGVFPGGLFKPPAHPQCRCSVALVIR
jgi:SPP1 gp7 family putative phage head morphogenesis protein